MVRLSSLLEYGRFTHRQSRVTPFVRILQGDIEAPHTRCKTAFIAELALIARLIHVNTLFIKLYFLCEKGFFFPNGLLSFVKKQDALQLKRLLGIPCCAEVG